MFGSHRSLLVRHNGPLLNCFLSDMEKLSNLNEFPIFIPKQLHAALILPYMSSSVVSLRYVVCPGYLISVTCSFFS